MSQVAYSQLSEKTSQSAYVFQQAKKVIPGGVSANIKYFPPHPIVMAKGKGSRLTDVDGNEYIDYLLCYGALILGHGHPAIVEAVSSQMASSGTFVYGTPHRLETELAEKLVGLFPGIDMVRYTNSGLEATLLAIRIAQAYTGKGKIAKFEGHYHGSYDQMLVSVNPDEEQAGEAAFPKAVSESKGIAATELERTIVLPFNDMQHTEDILRKNKDEIAAVILEPVQAGFIPAKAAFMKRVREVTEELGILLIFDEVKTGFRLTVGGAQSIYHVTPDLTALGKVLGGGFPIGAVGGKMEIMEIMDPAQGGDIFTTGDQDKKSADVMFHSGTYNGHPISLAAGLKTIEVLEEPGVMDDLLTKTNHLRNELEKLYRTYQIPAQTLGMGSIFNLLLTDKPIINYRDVKKAQMALRKQIDYELLSLGIYSKPLNRYSTSVPLSYQDIQLTVDAHEKAIKNVKGIQ